MSRETKIYVEGGKIIIDVGDEEVAEKMCSWIRVMLEMVTGMMFGGLT